MERGSREYWEEQLTEYWDSGLTIQEYSDLKDLPYETVRRWIRVLKKERVPEAASLKLVELTSPTVGSCATSAGVDIKVRDFTISSVRIYYCPTPVNLRKSFDGLAGAVQEYIREDLESGHIFAFFSRNRKLVKLLQWQGDGFCIYSKRLESGGFHIPHSADGRIELSNRELMAIKITNRHFRFKPKIL